MTTNLMMSAKMAALGFLKTKVFWNKDYDVIICVHDIANKILSCDSNSLSLVTLALLWEKFS